jgi:NADH-quinone oxidoreductase subunit E
MKMNTEVLLEALRKKIAATDHPRSLAVDVMYALQRHYGYLGDEALILGAGLLGMTPLELDELATFYDFIYREPVGKYVIHVCDSVICWMQGNQSIVEYISQKLSIPLGGTTEDGMFSLLPVCCIGFCDEAPVMLINGKPFGHLTPEKIDAILTHFKEEKPPVVEDR